MLTSLTKEECLELKNLLMRRGNVLLTKAFDDVAGEHLKRLATTNASDALEIKRLQTIVTEFPRLLRGIQEELDARLKDLHS